MKKITNEEVIKRTEEAEENYDKLQHIKLKKDIPSFEGLYAINEDGIVYSLQRTVNTKGNGIRIVPAKKLSTFKDKKGCEKVQLFKQNKKYILSINALKKQLFGE